MTYCDTCHVTDLELMEHVPPNVETARRVWDPFTKDPAFNHDSWWHGRNLLSKVGYSLWSGYSGPTEVVRMQLDTFANAMDYAGVPSLGHQVIGVERIEAPYPRRGHGTEALRILARESPDSRLIASAKDAQGYWVKLGWATYPHRLYGARWQLFVAPPRWAQH